MSFAQPWFASPRVRWLPLMDGRRLAATAQAVRRDGISSHHIRNPRVCAAERQAQPDTDSAPLEVLLRRIKVMRGTIKNVSSATTARIQDTHRSHCVVGLLAARSIALQWFESGLMDKVRTCTIGNTKYQVAIMIAITYFHCESIRAYRWPSGHWLELINIKTSLQRGSPRSHVKMAARWRHPLAGHSN